MKKALFIGACDKTDIILYIAKMLEASEAKVLVVDATKEKKYRYSIPSLDEAIQLVEFNNFDVALDCINENSAVDVLKGEKSKFDHYDHILIDTDLEDSVHEWTNIDTYFLVSNYERYTVYKNKELIDSLCKSRNKEEPLNITNINYEVDVSIDQDYIDSLLSNHSTIFWNKDSYFLPFDESNYEIKIENQYANIIKLKGLSRSFKKFLIHLTQQITSLSYKEAKKVMKKVERGK